MRPPPPHAPDRFQGTASYYARFRPSYPDELIDRLADQFELGPSGRVLDLGCGTGQLTIPLRRRAGGAVGVDLDPDMLTHAARLASAEGVDIQWQQCAAEAVPLDIGTFRLATIGRAFHWMDPTLVLRRLDQLVEPDGGCAIVGDGMPRSSSSEWGRALGMVLTDYLGPTRYTRDDAQDPGHDPFEVVLARSPFCHVETFALDYQRSWTAEALLGYLHSTSFAAPHRFGDRLQAFQEDVRDALGEGTFIEDVHLGAFIARRPRS